LQREYSEKAAIYKALEASGILTGWGMELVKRPRIKDAGEGNERKCNSMECSQGEIIDTPSFDIADRPKELKS